MAETQTQEKTETAEDLQRQLALARRQIEAVQTINAALYSVADMAELQQLALETAMNVVEADAGSLMMYDADRDALIFAYVVGPVAHTLIGTMLDLKKGLGIAGQVFRTGIARTTDDVRKDADHVGTVDARTGYQTQSMMTVPIRAPGSPAVGVLQLINKRTGRFDANDLAVIEVAVGMVATAVENAILAQDAKLAAVARSVGEISHDIGNMLTSVLPYVQSLEPFIEDVRDGKPGAITDLEAFYEEVTESVEDGVTQVVARTREIAGALKGEVTPMEFEKGHPLETAQKVVRSLTGSGDKAGIKLAVTGDAVLETVYDHSRIYNALFNLVNNAIPETPRDGHVTVTVTQDADPDWYRLLVTDTGRGMPEEVRARLFTDAARSTKIGGTGLGTRIVRRIVEQHGGIPSVESASGQGTTMILRLPKIPPASQERSAV